MLNLNLNLCRCLSYCNANRNYFENVLNTSGLNGGKVLVCFGWWCNLLYVTFSNGIGFPSIALWPLDHLWSLSIAIMYMYFNIVNRNILLTQIWKRYIRYVLIKRHLIISLWQKTHQIMFFDKYTCTRIVRMCVLLLSRYRCSVREKIRW